MDAGVSGMLCWKAIRARLVAMQSPARRLRVRHEPQHNIDLSHVPKNHSPARQAKRVYLVTAIRLHGVRSQTLMLAGLNGELIYLNSCWGSFFTPTYALCRLRARGRASAQCVERTARTDLPRAKSVHRENADLGRQKAVAHGNPPCATPSGKTGIGRICRRTQA